VTPPAASARALRAAALALAFGAVLAAGCGRIEVDRVYAVRLAAPPGDAQWEIAVPRYVKAGGGNVHGRSAAAAGLELDTDAVHGAAASCHHGPPVTHAVPVEVRAWYTDAELWVDVRWADPTEDRTPRAWRRGPEGWAPDAGDEDGVALLWGRDAGRFGCQEACHESDFTVRGGSLVDVRSMFLAKEGAREEAWVWKPSLGGRELILDHGGFRTPAGVSYRTVNSRVAADAALEPEVRRAGAFGRGDAPLFDAEGRPVTAALASAPAARWAPPGGELVTARARRTGTGWRVVFSRPLDPGGGRESFRPGGTYRFGLAIFDGTAVNHHVARDTQLLDLVIPAPPAPEEVEGREGNFRGAAGV
jgi:hypothetical protein